jgi:hypothetical protein
VIAFALMSAGCGSSAEGPMERIDGTWEVHAAATGGQCAWERRTYTFGPSTLRATVDVLCPGAGGEHVGCSVSAELPASWDESGRWQVSGGPIVARASVQGTGVKALPASTCFATLEPGHYVAAKVRGEPWKWEVTTPSEQELRLRRPDTDRPDYVAALRDDPDLDDRRKDPASHGGPGVETTSVWGPYRVSQVTEAGVTEDFSERMMRAAQALERDCVVADLIYDFRAAAGSTSPTEVVLTEARTCEKGGLGTFRHELAATLPIAWAEEEGGALLVVPAVTAGAGVVRLKDLGEDAVPAQWIADDLGVRREETTFLVAIEPNKTRKPGPPPGMRLKTVGGTVFHLVPAS